METEEYTREEYTKHYIVEALFRLMDEYEYEKISVIDIARKAGVGRATFYRHFKRKEDVIIYYFDHARKKFVFGRRYYPRCKADYIRTVTDVLTMFKNREREMKLIRRAHLEYVYLEYLNRNFSEMFREEYPETSIYRSYAYAGMLFNLSMAWLDGGCREAVESLAETLVGIIYFEK